PAILTNGQVAEVRPEQSPKPVLRPAADAFTFQQGIITFNEARMDEISETLSRYRHQPVNVQANVNLDSKVTAVVKTRNVEKFLNSLPMLAPVEIDYQRDQAVIMNQTRK